MIASKAPVATSDEVTRIVARYDRRSRLGRDARVDILQPHRWLAQQEKERAWLRFLRRYDPNRVGSLRLLEVGCGNGENLRQLLRWGFSPENLVGNELLPDRCADARRLLPGDVAILEGDASRLDLPAGSFDLVLQSTVFTSILNDRFQQSLADRMWELLAPGGFVVWYDFQFDNPKNPDVRGVKLPRIRELFPKGTVRSRRLSLAPPLARAACRFGETPYHLLNAIPWLRSHLFCWIEKPREASQQNS